MLIPHSYSFWHPALVSSLSRIPFFVFAIFFGKQINVRCRLALSIDILKYTLVLRSGGKAEAEETK